MSDKKQVVFDHDGGIDDFLSLLLLLTMEHVELLAITITPADCYLEKCLCHHLQAAGDCRQK